MNLGRYRLIAQQGAGWDGVRFRAVDPDGDVPVEVRLISGAKADPERWPGRCRQLRLAAQLAHPVIQRVRELSLESDPPYVVMEWVEVSCLGELAGPSVPIPVGQALALASALTDALTAGHRLGLAHGRLGPATILGADASTLKIDFTGLDIQFDKPNSSLPDVEASCRPPSKPATAPDKCSADIFALGAMLAWLLTGRPVTRPTGTATLELHLEGVPEAIAAPLAILLDEMQHPAPAERPTATLAGESLRRLLDDLNKPAFSPACSGETQAFDVAAHALIPKGFSNELARTHLGRFRLLDKLGQGGMGTVYRAEDSADGSTVAIKILRADWACHPNSLRRFLKEARLLAEVNNPYVANLLEVNEDDGIHYLALEFVAGKDLAALLLERGRLDERQAMSIMADVARALVEAHQRGIVHRDIKPDNILLEEQLPGKENSDLPHSVPRRSDTLRVKFSDFGLARHVEQTESLNMTQAGSILGTPLYMSPEQCSNAKIDPRSDIYSMGATLFHLLAGRPPFVGEAPLDIILSHATQAPPSLRKLIPELSEAVCQIVEKTLAKAPDQRYADAAALLADLERLLRGEAGSIAVHPRLPAHDARNVIDYDLSLELEATPAELWPYVSNTERVNRAIGLPAVEYAIEADPNLGRHRFGMMRKVGIDFRWEEHPYEWIEGRRMGVLREFQTGVLHWYVSTVELAPRLGGTTLRHRIRLVPRGLFGRTVAAVEVGIRARRNLERVYRRIDAAITGKLGSQARADAFEDPATLSAARQRRLESLLEQLVAVRIDPDVVEKLGDFLATAPAQEVARIRPLALARRLALAPDAVVAACLHAAHVGLLQLLWDILCPVCRIPAQIQNTLKELREHGRCEACNLDFQLDFANSVELIFRAHPEIRDSELGVFCVGGPAHSPHVVVQARIAPGERIELDLALAEGAYRFRGPQLPYTLDLRVETSATAAARWELFLSRGLDPALPRILRPGHQVLALMNDFDREVVVRVERAAPRGDALTAARAAALSLFRELFPAEVLAPGRLVSVATVTLLVTDLEGGGDLYRKLGDARAFALLHEHLRQLGDAIRREGGAIVKVLGAGVLAVFSEAVSAVRAGLALPREAAAAGVTFRLRAGVHRGPAMAATINEHLDYFGATVNSAIALPGLANGGELALTSAVGADPQVAALLRTAGVQGEIIDEMPADWTAGPVQRIRMRDK